MSKKLTRFVIVVLWVLGTMSSRVLAGNALLSPVASSDPSGAGCDARALAAGFDSTDAYFCPGKGATIDVLGAGDVSKGIWLGSSFTSVTVLTDAQVTSEDPDLARMTGKSVNLGVLSGLSDEQQAASFLRQGSRTTPVRFRNCVCAGCRYPDAAQNRCVAAGCHWWCCVCLDDSV